MKGGRLAGPFAELRVTPLALHAIFAVPHGGRQASGTVPLVPLTAPFTDALPMLAGGGAAADPLNEGAAFALRCSLPANYANKHE